MLKYGCTPNKNYHPISEEIMKQSGNKSKCRINRVEVTTDTLTGRGGMALFVRYIESGDMRLVVEFIWIYQEE